MCGIFISNNPSITQEQLPVIENSLRFRGPDCSSDLIEHNGWKAYHSRLSIIDIDTGSNQPVLDDAGGMLVFNGEILNYKELGLKYFNRLYKSDTSLLSDLASNKKLVLDELDGFFAFVYINAIGELECAARDRFGVKPLYMHKVNGYITFCSEAITLKKLYNLGVNELAVEEYYSTRAPIFSSTYFNDLTMIEPGNCYIKGQYFNCLDYLTGEYNDVNLDDLEEALLLGIETRKISDAPVGLLLSRGIDSNLLKEFGQFDKYYSVGFSGDEDIEFLKTQNINGLTVLESQPQEYLKDFEYLLKLRGEPMSVPNEVLLYQVSKLAAKDGIKVLLSGEGADEFFAGYDRIFKWASSVDKLDVNKFIEMYCYTPPDIDSHVHKQFKSLFANKTFVSPFEAVRWFFIRYHMPILFRRLDFSLMAAGVEGREPIANMHIFTLAVAMSPSQLIGDVLGKLPLRNLISKRMGNAFAFEKKIGFPVDLTKVFDNFDNLNSYELWFKANLRILE